MTPEFEFEHLPNVPIERLCEVFNLAFSDYVVPMKLSSLQLQNRLKRIGYDAQLSGGAIAEGALCGFVLHASGTWQAKKAVYNGGTGVIPAQRGHGLTQKMYEFLLPTLKQKGFELGLLEVISTNTAAIKSYEKIGFRKGRLLNCFVSGKAIGKPKKSTLHLQLVKSEWPQWPIYQSFADTVPSWQNQDMAVARAFADLILVEAYHKTQTVGYILFQPENGRIDQLGVHPNFRKKGIGRQLIRAAAEMSTSEKITFLNIENGSSADHFLQHLGFDIPFKQYEMMLEIG